MLSSFNHRCRNSLNGIKMSLYLFKREIGGPRPNSLCELERSYQQIEALFDRLQMLYRPLSLTLVRSPLGRFFDERLNLWQSWFSVRGRTIEISRPTDDLPCDFDPMLMALGLDAFAAWRAEACPAASHAVLTWRIADGSPELTWSERCPGNNGSPRAGENGTDRTRDANVEFDSLAQVLLKRVILAHRGCLEFSCEPGLVMTLRWPRLQSVEPARCCSATG
jgi:hypothetical protein